MNSSTRITRGEVVDLCETIFAENPDLPAFGARALGLYLCVRLTLTYLRHNWSAWCFSDWGSFSSCESIGWRPCQQRNTQRSSRPKWCVR